MGCHSIAIPEIKAPKRFGVASETGPPIKRQTLYANPNINPETSNFGGHKSSKTPSSFNF